MRTYLVKILLFSLIVTTLAGCSDEKSGFEPSGKIVKVGFLGPLTGSEASLGTYSFDGAKVALSLRPYILNGDRVELVEVDESGDPEAAQLALVTLQKDPSFAALLLGGGSNGVLPLQEYLNQNSIPSVALLATHPDVTKGDHIVQLPFDDIHQGTVSALFVMDELIIDNVAVFMERENVHSSFLAGIFSETFREAGGEVEVLHYPLPGTDLIETLSRLQDRNVQLLYLPLNGADVIEIESACRTLDYHPEVMLSDGILSQIVADNNSDLTIVEGMMASDVYSTARVTKGYGEEILKEVESSIAGPKTTYTGLGAEGMSLLLQAMDGCGDSTDRDCITRNLHSVKGFVGLSGPISITEEGKAERPLFINRIVDGKLYFKVMVY